MNKLLHLIGPGLLVAATGVGAGDLITASLAGSYVGLSLLWTPIIGALLKWSLNEGLTRWQMATSTTLIEGLITHFRAITLYIFMPYFFIWSYSVGGALIKACGTGADGLIPIPGVSSWNSQIIWGIFHALLSYFLIKVGRLKLIEKLMSLLVITMFLSTMISFVLLVDDWSMLFISIFKPKLPQTQSAWTMGVLGGVGGTLTILSYGYWIKEKGREDIKGLKTSQWDLGSAYFLTAFFSLAMIVIGHEIPQLTNNTDTLRPSIIIAQHLSVKLSPWIGTIFRVGFWAAVFSSLLGVLQSVPYLFADIIYNAKTTKDDSSSTLKLEQSRAYQWYLVGLTLCSVSGVFFKLKFIQLFYAITGALFMPFLAGILLHLNNSSFVRSNFKNKWWANALLVSNLLLFTYIGLTELIKIF